MVLPLPGRHAGHVTDNQRIHGNVQLTSHWPSIQRGPEHAQIDAVADGARLLLQATRQLARYRTAVCDDPGWQPARCLAKRTPIDPTEPWRDEVLHVPDAG